MIDLEAVIEAGERVVDALLAPHVLLAISSDREVMAQLVAAAGAVRVTRAAYEAGLIMPEHAGFVASMQQQLGALTATWEQAATALKGVKA